MGDSPLMNKPSSALGFVVSLTVVGAVTTAGMVFAAPDALQNAAAKTQLLRIVVIEGEGAINIIQQKTATAPERAESKQR